MAPNCFLTLLLILPLYSETPSLSLAGVDLRLGMAKDGILTIFAAMPNVKIDQIGGDWYTVNVKLFDLWEPVGDLIFRSGRLTRISSTENETDEKPARTLAKAFYNAVASGEKTGLVDVWTGTNGNANSPVYEVHLVFKDREVVVSTASFRDLETASVKTYFPRVRTSERTP